MSIKVKMQIYLILLASFLMLLSIVLQDITLGKTWFNLNANSLVGIQSFFEEISISNKYGLFFYEIIIILLSTNLFFLSGIFSILISLGLFLYLDP